MAGRFASIHKKVLSNKRKRNNKGLAQTDQPSNNSTTKVSNNNNKNDQPKTNNEHNSNKRAKVDNQHNKNVVPTKPQSISVKHRGNQHTANTVTHQVAIKKPHPETKKNKPVQNTSQKLSLNSKQSRPQSTSTKFFELLEKEGIGNNDHEDKDEIELRDLRKKLNIKADRLPSDFAADGLDYILNGIGGTYGENSDASEAESEQEEMTTMKRPVPQTKINYGKSYGISDSESDGDSAHEAQAEGETESEGSEDGVEDEDEDEAEYGDEYGDEGEDEDGGGDGDEDQDEDGDEDEDEGEGEAASDKNASTSQEFKEDIYGRLRSVATGEIVQQPKTGVYVPPMRSQANASVQLVRQVKGLFNKLSPTNVHSIVTELESIFRANSKNEMASVLTDCIMLSCLGDARGIASLAVASVSVLACLVDLFGTELGGQFLEALAKRFEESYKTNKSRDAANAILLFIHIYNFGLVHCVLIYDLIKMFIANFTELDVELILTVIQNAGSSLRKDDPASLKEIVVQVLERAKQREQAGSEDPHFSTSRMKYMVEAITDLKNNKAKPPPTAELIPQLKRAQRGIVGKRGGKGGELKITYDELINVKTRGRWWVVGSGWTGTLADKKSMPQPLVKLDHAQLGITVDLLALAAKQKMNTDLRRQIFCILMASEDYVDAVAKLRLLGLKGKSKDVVHVIMHCCQHEKQFNRFYAQVAGYLCEQNNEFKFSLQIAFYQKLKNLEENELNKRSIWNISQFLAHVVGDLALSIFILKAISLTSMTPQQGKFLEVFFIYLFSKFEEKKIYEVFKRLMVMEAAEADRAAKDITIYLDRFFDINTAMATHTQATTKSNVIDKRSISKRLDLATKILKMPL